VPQPRRTKVRQPTGRRSLPQICFGVAHADGVSMPCCLPRVLRSETTPIGCHAKSNKSSLANRHNAGVTGPEPSTRKTPRDATRRQPSRCATLRISACSVLRGSLLLFLLPLLNQGHHELGKKHRHHSPSEWRIPLGIRFEYSLSIFLTRW
jgi:hypothetical protein